MFCSPLWVAVYELPSVRQFIYLPSRGNPPYFCLNYWKFTIYQIYEEYDMFRRLMLEFGLWFLNISIVLSRESKKLLHTPHTVANFICNGKILHFFLLHWCGLLSTYLQSW